MRLPAPKNIENKVTPTNRDCRDVSFALIMCASLRIVVSVMGETVSEWSAYQLDEFDDGRKSLHELLRLAGTLVLDLEHSSGGGDDRTGAEEGLVAHASAGDERRCRRLDIHLALDRCRGGALLGARGAGAKRCRLARCRPPIGTRRCSSWGAGRRSQTLPACALPPPYRNPPCPHDRHPG